jgi:3-phytase
MNRKTLLLAASLLLVFACNQKTGKEAGQEEKAATANKIKPALITEKVPNDSDDPAIWYNKQDPSKSLILGTDKHEKGGIYTFDLDGKIIKEKTMSPVARPNNIDLEYGFAMGDTSIDIAVFTERLEEKIRVISVPDMRYIDGGGIPVFQGEDSLEFRAPMGIALYKSPKTGDIHAIVSRKNGPTDGSYLWQYRLEWVNDSTVGGNFVQSFGDYSGGGEIEAIAIDDAEGMIYYSDESAGIRRYLFSSDSTLEPLTMFGQNDFKEDREGIAILKQADSTDWLIISDQQEHTFNCYLDNPASPEAPTRNFVWNLSTIETDGCDVIGDSLSPRFPKGIFVAMSEGGVFHVYDMRDFGEK